MIFPLVIYIPKLKQYSIQVWKCRSSNWISEVRDGQITGVSSWWLLMMMAWQCAQSDGAKPTKKTHFTSVSNFGSVVRLIRWNSAYIIPCLSDIERKRRLSAPRPSWHLMCIRTRVFLCRGRGHGLPCDGEGLREVASVFPFSDRYAGCSACHFHSIIYQASDTTDTISLPELYYGRQCVAVLIGSWCQGH